MPMSDMFMDIMNMMDQALRNGFNNQKHGRKWPVLTQCFMEALC